MLQNYLEQLSHFRGHWPLSLAQLQCFAYSNFNAKTIEEGILEAKTECYEKDKVKSPPFFRSFYDDF